ncbi:MAG: site-specific integrase [Vicinamibacterales bacterium]
MRTSPDEVAALCAAEAEIPADLLRRARRASGSVKAGRVATNRLLTRLRHLFAWAVGKDLVQASPFLKAGVNVVKVDGKAEGGRQRRLEGDEEIRLLATAGPHLQACIETTLASGLRKSEILGPQWQHVKIGLGLIDVPATVAKTGTARQVVITPRVTTILAGLAAVQRKALELEPDDILPLTGHPFGNEIGERVKDIKTAWRQTCRRAGIQGLRFHDLRREAGSRLLETPTVTVIDVRNFLGHSSVAMTNNYLSCTTVQLKDALAKRDASRTNLAHVGSDDLEQKTAPVVTH